VRAHLRRWDGASWVETALYYFDSTWNTVDTAG